MNVVVRSSLPMATLQPTVTSVVREADPSLPVIGLRPMDDVISGSLGQPRMLMHLFGGFAALTLLLAAVGTYGMLSYLVTQRRREIGIRMALGAGRETILGSVMAHGLTLALEITQSFDRFRSVGLQNAAADRSTTFNPGGTTAAESVIAHCSS